MLRCVGAALCCWCLESFWRIIFTAPGNWNEMSAWFCSLHWHCSGLLCVWSALLWSVLFPFPQCKPIYALSRLADSLVRIHSSLILVSFACARAGRSGERSLDCEWTCLGLFCSYDDAVYVTVSAYAAHCSLLLSAQFSVVAQFTVPSSQFPVLLTLSSTKWLMVECINYWCHPRQCGGLGNCSVEVYGRKANGRG